MTTTAECGKRMCHALLKINRGGNLIFRRVSYVLRRAVRIQILLTFSLYSHAAFVRRVLCGYYAELSIKFMNKNVAVVKFASSFYRQNDCYRI